MSKATLRIIIAGSRRFDNYNFMRAKLRRVDIGNYDVTVISGTAKGADRLGEQWAKNHKFNIERYPANWSMYGKTAGIIRNRQMAEHADMCVVFWDGESKGTLNMIQTARDVGIPVYVFIYPKEVEE